MDSHKFRKLLKRYQQGTANETERALVEAWYDSYHQDNIAPVSDDVKNNILARINASVQTPKTIHRKLWSPYLKIAATVLLISGIGFAAYLRITRQQPVLYSTVQTKPGEVKRLMLADSSVVWVNASSRIRFPLQFDGRKRELFIEDGEAFSEVKHKPTLPFIVHVQKLNVQVLGTSFNINAYRNMPALKVMVVTGKVGVSQKGKPTILLNPGQELAYDNNSREYSQQTVRAEATQGWKRGFTYLQQATFNELAAVMKNQLGVLLKAGSPAVDHYRFTLRIQQNLPLNQTLQMISQIHNTHYRKEGNEIIIY